MALGLLLVILGFWITINGWNGNIPGLLKSTPSTKVDVSPVVATNTNTNTGSSQPPIITPGKP